MSLERILFAQHFAVIGREVSKSQSERIVRGKCEHELQLNISILIMISTLQLHPSMGLYYTLLHQDCSQQWSTLRIVAVGSGIGKFFPALLFLLLRLVVGGSCFGVVFSTITAHVL